LQFTLQSASLETFGYILVQTELLILQSESLSSSLSLLIEFVHKIQTLIVTEIRKWGVLIQHMYAAIFGWCVL